MESSTGIEKDSRREILGVVDNRGIFMDSFIVWQDQRPFTDRCDNESL